jgi:hypothetical protein
MLLKEKLQGLLYLMCEIGDAGSGAWAVCTISGTNSLGSKMEFQITVDDLIAMTDGLESGWTKVAPGALTPTGEAAERARYEAIYDAAHANSPVDPDTSFDVTGFEYDLLKRGYKVVKA